MKLIAISDVHNRQNKLTIPECDLLIVAGDYTLQGRDSEVKNFCEWLNKQPARHKLIVQGNHEVDVQEDFDNAYDIAQEACPGVLFVEHELVIIEGIKIFLSAWTPYFNDWAYNAHRFITDGVTKRNPFIKELWKDIPNDVDIIVTHGPVHGIHDQVYQVDGVTPKERVGCWHLLEKVMQTNAKVHICGHIHSGHGQKEFMGKHFYNVSVCGETYSVDYEPTEIIW
jgi:Icc-related predicted phosphoesterase